MSLDTNRIENVLNIYEVKIERGITATDTNPIRLFGVADYQVKDIGKSVSRMQQVNDSAVYFQEQNYRNGFKDISFTAYCFKDDFDDLYTEFKVAIASDTNDARLVKFTDIYGHSFNYAYIANLTWELPANNATNAVHLAIELIVLPDVKTTIFRPLKTGEAVSSLSVKYLIEACSIKQYIPTPQMITNSDNTLSVTSLAYTTNMYEVTMSGIEILDHSTYTADAMIRGALTGTLVNTAFSFTLVGFTFSGKTMQGLLTSLETNLVPGAPQFQNFNFTAIVTDTANILSSSSSVSIIESWTVTDLAARASYHKTQSNFIYQVFTPVTLYEVNLNVITNDPAAYPSGTVLGSNLALPGFTSSSGTQLNIIKGLILDKSISKFEGTTRLKKLALKIVGKAS